MGHIPCLKLLGMENKIVRDIFKISGLQKVSGQDLISKPFSVLAYAGPLVLMVLFAFIAWQWPDYYVREIVSKDSLAGAGLAEDLTVLVLIPGILLTFYALVRYRQLVPNRLIGCWFLLWAFACIYFAGEEISWGQWYFQWETGEAFRQVNDQQETNLHNISSWLDQKPRTLVELWVLVTGIFYPLSYWLRKRPNYQPSQFQYWFIPTREGFSTALFFVILYVLGWGEVGPLTIFASSELREFTIALFLALFLLSFVVRLKKLAALKG